MSFFEDASLVLIPSAQKTSKVYSVKPTDGSGDLTFSRSNDTATRVGPDGLIEKVRTNLFLNSNNFSSGSWTKNNFTLTSGQADPFGGTNAWKAQSTSAVQADLRQVVSGAGVYSIYAKAGNFSIFQLWNGTTGIAFNLSAGTAAGGGVISSVGNGWYRCSVLTSTTGSFTAIPFINSAVGDFVYLAFSQAEAGDIATDYIATTSAAVSVGPVANVPRLDYTGGGCPKLLLEPQRTNLVTFSEQINNAAWITNGAVTITANTTISPDGFQNADSIIATGAFNGVFRTIGVANATQHTFSLYVKSISLATSINIGVSTNPSGATINFNAVTGVIASVGAAITASSVSDAGNGWYRISATYTTTGTSNDFIIFATGAMSFCVYGCQLEASSYSTSYIPTLGAAVTRGADAASKTGISSLIGQTEGTIFFEINSSNFESYTQRIFSISDDTNDNAIGFQLTGANEINYYVEVGGVLSALITKTAPAITLGQNVKVAAAYKANDFVLYIGGVQVGTDSSGGVPATSVLRYANPTGNAPYVGKVVQTLLFKTRLTNSQLAELTA